MRKELTKQYYDLQKKLDHFEKSGCIQKSFLRAHLRYLVMKRLAKWTIILVIK